jgi:hypothetical protein
MVSQEFDHDEPKSLNNISILDFWNLKTINYGSTLFSWCVQSKTLSPLNLNTFTNGEELVK